MIGMNKVALLGEVTSEPIDEPFHQRRQTRFELTTRAAVRDRKTGGTFYRESAHRILAIHPACRKTAMSLRPGDVVLIEGRLHAGYVMLSGNDITLSLINSNRDDVGVSPQEPLDLPQLEPELEPAEAPTKTLQAPIDPIEPRIKVVAPPKPVELIAARGRDGKPRPVEVSKSKRKRLKLGAAH